MAKIVSDSLFCMGHNKTNLCHVRGNLGVENIANRHSVFQALINWDLGVIAAHVKLVLVFPRHSISLSFNQIPSISHKSSSLPQNQQTILQQKILSTHKNSRLLHRFIVSSAKTSPPSRDSFLPQKTYSQSIKLTKKGNEKPNSTMVDTRASGFASHAEKISNNLFNP